ncbi:MAG: hypothetical protein AABX24_04615 [Nanoarchaeota archaeon]
MVYKKIKTPDSGKKIKVIGAEMKKIDTAKIAERLGAKIVNIPEISAEEAAQYEPIGSPVMMPDADRLNIYHFGSRMLRAYQKSLDDVIGYRVLDADEEKEFRQQCAEKDRSYLHRPLVRYYSKKSEQK